MDCRFCIPRPFWERGLGPHLLHWGSPAFSLSIQCGRDARAPSDANPDTTRAAGRAGTSTVRDIIRSVPPYAYAILTAGWVLWCLPFLINKRNSASPAKVDRRARWGILLIAIAYTLLLQGSFWTRFPGVWRTSASVFFFALGSLLSWTGVRALGRQWRVDAGLNADHELVQSGPYRFVRHPIYTSMLCVFAAAALILSTPLPLLLPAILLFIIGTEIRVRIEDKLLASLFGDRFAAYQKSVPAYIPLVR
ncbi:MAG TPA: isoprenylcysteine carboxylmethyltransferase family protein [Terriglobia bacterium]|nr:isoprenylcysteine carboxylmethyltransferase family protein [Terriglobia bacterium]